MFLTAHTDEWHIKTGCLTLRHGVRDTAMRCFGGDVAISPEAEHKPWRGTLDE